MQQKLNRERRPLLSKGKIIISLVLFVLLLRLGLNSLLGYVLKEVFTEGTGCKVELHSPEVHFFPTGAQVKDVAIVCPGEAPEKGFRSERISIRLHPLKLFHKELLLSDLNLDGASAYSADENSSFMRVMVFLFGEKPKRPENWLSRALSAWVFHITTINIQTRPVEDALVLNEAGFRYAWDTVRLNFVEQQSDPKLPYDLKAEAENFSVNHEQTEELLVDRLNAEVVLGLGKLWIKPESVFERQSDSISLEGVAELKGQGRYDIKYRANLSQQTLPGLLSKFKLAPQNIPEKLELQGTLVGALSKPQAAGKFKARFGRDAFFLKHPGCGFTDVEFKFDSSPERAIISDLAVENLLNRGHLEIRTGGEEKFTAKAGLALEAEEPWVQSCVVQRADTKIQANLRQALSDLQAELSVEGTLNPLGFRFKLEGENAGADAKRHSRIKAEGALEGRDFRLLLNERGASKMIQPLPLAVPLAAAISEDLPQTPFAKEINTNLDLDARFNLDSGDLKLRNLNLLRFPALNLLARSAPFIPQDYYSQLQTALAEDSLLNLKASADFNLKQSQGAAQGKLELLAFNPLGITAQRMVLPFAFSNGELSVAELLVEFKKGYLKGSANYQTRTRRAKGGLDLSGFETAQLKNFPALARMVSELSGSVNFQAQGGKLEYSGDLSGELQGKLGEKLGPRSKLNFSGNENSLRLTADILQGELSGELNYQLQGSRQGQIEAQVSARSFQLAKAFPAASEEDTLSGRFGYQGKVGNLLLGSGDLVLNDLRLLGSDLGLSVKQPLRMQLANGRLNFSQVDIKPATGKEFQLSGYLDRQEGWNARVKGNWDLAQFDTEQLGIEHADGLLDLQLKISGPAASPLFDGGLRLNKGGISVPLKDSVLAFSNLEIDSRLAGETFELHKLSAEVGGGKLSAEGVFRNILSKEQMQAEAKLRIEQATVEPIPHLSVLLDSQLSLKKEAAGRPRISGSVLLKNAVYEYTLNLSRLLETIARFIGGGSSTAKVGSQATALPFDYDINLKAAKGLFVETNIAEMQLKGDLNLSGSSSIPKIAGEVAVVDGIFGFQAREFDIQTGVLRFNPEGNSYDPDLTIVAESFIRVKDGQLSRVRMTIDGSLSDPRVGFDSDSGLKQEEIQAAMGIGANFEAGNYLKRFGRRSTTNRLRSVVELLSPVSGVSLKDRLLGLTEFSSIQLEFGLAPNTGEFVPKVLARRPVTRDIELELSSELSAEQVSMARLQYPFTSFWGIFTSAQSTPASQTKGESTLSVGLDYQATYAGNLWKAEFKPLYAERKEERRLPEIVEISLKGERPLECPDLEQDIKDNILGRKPSIGNLRLLKLDILLALREASYLGASVDFTIIPQGASERTALLAVDLRAGRKQQLEFQGNKLFSNTELLELLGLSSRTSPITSGALQRFAREIEEHYQERGYYQAKVRMDKVSPRGTEEKVIFQISEGEKFILTERHFSGNKRFSTAVLERELARVPASTESGTLGVLSKQVLVEQQIQLEHEALERFYRANGFLDVSVNSKVETLREAQEGSVPARLTFEIEEGKPAIVKTVELLWKDGANWQDERLGFVSLASEIKAGQVFNMEAIAKERERLQEILIKRGFPNALVVAQTEVEKGVLRYQLSLGEEVWIAEVKIEGCSVTDVNWIRQKLLFKSGDPLRTDLLLASERELYRLGVFKKVEIRAADGSLDSSKENLVVRVEERDSGKLGAQIALNSEDGLHLSGEIGQRNLFGHAERLALGVDGFVRPGDKVLDAAGARLQFAEPNLAGENSTLFLEGFVQTSIDLIDPYNFDRLGGSLSLRRTLGEHLAGSVGLTSYTETLHDVPEDIIIGEGDTDSTFYSFLSTELEWDQRDNSFNPRQGRRSSLRARVNPELLGSSVQFYELVAKHSEFIPLGSRLVWANNASLDFLNPFGGSDTIPLSQRLFLGGRNSLRGYSRNSIGPRSVDSNVAGGDLSLRLSTELQYSLTEAVVLLLFVDAGQSVLKNRGSFEGENDSLSDLIFSPGLGVRYKTPIGPLSAEFGFATEREHGESLGRLNFAIGGAF